EHRTPARLAAALGEQDPTAEPTPAVQAPQSAPLLPLMRRLVTRGRSDQYHQSVTVTLPPTTRAHLAGALGAVLGHHEALRMRVTGADGFTVVPVDDPATYADALLTHVPAPADATDEQ
ncbi:hypothetical protein, partial [Streptomyces parvus]